MTERKPPNLSWQSWIERQIHDAQQDGAFDDLHGHGRPIDGLDNVHDEMWWVKAKLRAEDIDYLPPTIAIRAERAAAVDAAMSAATEVEVRRLVDEVNVRIRYVNSHATSGPPSTVAAIDLDAFIERWRTAQSHDEPPEPASDEVVSKTPTPRRQRWRWWKRHGSRRGRTSSHAVD